VAEVGGRGEECGCVVIVELERLGRLLWDVSKEIESGNCDNDRQRRRVDRCKYCS
jgi:hypothetical protein